MARILVIDDDPAVRSVVTLLLERRGHQMMTAQDGQRGLAAIETGELDLVMIDIFMPEMDGIETILRVRKAKPMLPIVVMSGGAAFNASIPDYLSIATKLGAVTSLRKPFKPDALIEAVETCLQSKAEGEERNGTR
jgi:DNA-binding NtrC family response regulator